MLQLIATGWTTVVLRCPVGEAKTYGLVNGRLRLL